MKNFFKNILGILLAPFALLIVGVALIAMQIDYFVSEFFISIFDRRG